MFGGSGGSGDPFGNPFEHMHRQMRQMDNLMNVMIGDAFDMLNSFGMGMPPARHPMLTNDQFGQPHPGRPHFPNNDMAMMSPFGGFGFGAPFLGGMMNQMQNLHNRALHDPNSVVLSESTMISYDGSGQPKIVQSSTRKAGDVKETRKAVRDNEREEMTIGHSIGDRTHIIEKKRDKDGQIRQQQKFINLKEDEAHDFNERFKAQARQNIDNGLAGLFGGSSRNRHHAIGNGRDSYAATSGGGRNRGRSHYTGGGGGQTSSTPIITIPDDDEEEEPVRHGNGRSGNNNRYRYGAADDVVYSNNGTGPTIQEIDDDATESAANPKRRKGVFGKFLG